MTGPSGARRSWQLHERDDTRRGAARRAARQPARRRRPRRTTDERRRVRRAAPRRPGSRASVLARARPSGRRLPRSDVSASSADSLYRLGIDPARRVRRPLRPGGALMTSLEQVPGRPLPSSFVLACAGTAAAYHTRFVAENCNYDHPDSDGDHHPRRLDDGRAARATRGLPVGRRLLERQRPGRLAGRPDRGSGDGRRGWRLLGVHVQGLA